MTQEEKQLLFRDLCGRLPYGVRIHIDFKENGHIVGDATLNTITSITGQIFGFADFEQDFKNGDCCPVSGFGSNKLLHLEEFKPYLRPMSSMTEEERKEYYETMDEYTHRLYPNSCDWSEHTEYSWTIATFDWLNKKMFDYRDLIPMGLAIEAPEGLYK